jgi:CHAT domain-containing protein/tetratricopeptide (TPR) repeat protein
MGLKYTLAIAATLVGLGSMPSALAAEATLAPLGGRVGAIAEFSPVLLAQGGVSRFQQLRPQLEAAVAQLHPDIVATRAFGSTSPDYGDYVQWSISVTLRDGLSLEEQAAIAQQVAAYMVGFRLEQEGALFPPVPNYDAVGGLLALFELPSGDYAPVSRAVFTILSYDPAAAEVKLGISGDAGSEERLIGRVAQGQFIALGAGSPDPSANAEQLQAQGEAQYEAGDLVAARASLEAARDRFRELGNTEQEFWVLDQLAVIYDELGLTAATEAALTRQGETALALRDPLKLRRVGTALKCRNHLDAALALYGPARDLYRRQSIDGASLQGNFGLQQELWTVVSMAQVLIKAERWAEAETLLQDGIARLETVFTQHRPDPLEGDAELDRQIREFAEFFNRPLSSNNLYLMLQRVLIAQSKTDDALVAIEQGRTKALEELWAVKQPGNRLTAPSLADIQAVAQQRQATVVTYSFDLFVDPCGWEAGTEPALLTWVISPAGDIQFHQQAVPFDRLPGNPEDLQDLVAGVRSQLGARGLAILAANPERLTIPPAGPAAQNTYLRSLHDLLIEPIADSLSDEPTDPVIFVPDFVLFLVPFPALQAADGSYLIDHHTPLTAPSIQALQLTAQSRQRSRPARSNPLIVGNPTYSPVELRWDQPVILPQLPGAEQEALTIADQLGTTALIGPDATKTAILERLSEASLIHLATHGLLETVLSLDIPGAIAVAQSGEGFTHPIPLPGTNRQVLFSDNGLITTRDLLTFRLQAELVVLSACNTGGGELTGDGVTGLSRAFIAAGVPSIIVSLWSVPDAPTGELMAVFYEEWLRHGDKAQALRQAMLATRDRYPNPINWAAFTLIGESQ